MRHSQSVAVTSFAPLVPNQIPSLVEVYGILFFLNDSDQPVSPLAVQL